MKNIFGAILIGLLVLAVVPAMGENVNKTDFIKVKTGCYEVSFVPLMDKGNNGAIDILSPTDYTIQVMPPINGTTLLDNVTYTEYKIYVNYTKARTQEERDFLVKEGYPNLNTNLWSCLMLFNFSTPLEPSTDDWDTAMLTMPHTRETIELFQTTKAGATRDLLATDGETGGWEHGIILNALDGGTLSVIKAGIAIGSRLTA